MKQIFKILSGALLVAFLLNACQDDRQSDKKLEKIQFVLDWVPNTNHSGLFLAKERGYFKDAGLDVEIVQPPQGSTTQLIGAGHAPFGIGFQESLAKYFSRDASLPVVALAAILEHNTIGIVSLKSKNITRPRDLAGHSYATWEDPIEQAMLKFIVQKDGGDAQNIKIMPFESNVALALDKLVDSSIVYYGWEGIEVLLKGFDINFIRFSDYAPELDYYTPVIIANAQYVSQNKATTKKLMSAIKKGYIDAINDPESAIKALLKASPELDEKLVRQSQLYLSKEYASNPQKWGYIDPARWDRFYEWLYQNKLIKRQIPAGFGFSNEYLGY